MELKYNLALSELMDFFCEGMHKGFLWKNILAAEKRLGVALPESYRNFLLAYGKDEVNSFFNQIAEPQEICSSYEAIQEELNCDWGEEFQEAVEQGTGAEYEENLYFKLWQLPREQWQTITEDYILIWYENQGIWSAGYRKKDLLEGVADPPVYISTEDDYITYQKFTDNTEDFLLEMLRAAACGWNGGQRYTKQADIERVLAETGISQAQLQAAGGNGSCLAGEQLYLYTSFADYRELLVNSRRLPEPKGVSEVNPQPPESSAGTKRETSSGVQMYVETGSYGYRPQYGPRRLALLPHQMQDLGMKRPKPENGIPLHPLVALLIQQNFNHVPSTAYDWGRDIARIKFLTIEPRYGTRRTGDEENIYIYPPGEHFPPAPYYFDLNDWSVIGRMTKLQALTIHHIYVDDFSFLESCVNLKKLDLYNTNFADCRLLLNLPALREVDLRFCSLEHQEVLEGIAAKILT